jgi:GST-like protein
MIHLHTWTTPNGRKISLLLEELGVPYDVHPVNIGKGDQFKPEFLAISPNNKIPAIVDDEADGGPLSIFESGAIMIYLADKYGKFLPKSGHERFKVLEWLFWQVGGQGPMFGQLGWFVVSAPEPNPMAIERYRAECDRLLGVMEKRLSEAAYLGGDYSIADMAVYPWIMAYRMRVKDIIEPLLANRPHITAWLDKIGQRPAAQRGMNIPPSS